MMSVALFTLHQQNTHPCGLHDKQSEEDPAHDNFTLHLRVDHFKVFRKLVGGGERGKTLRRREREGGRQEEEGEGEEDNYVCGLTLHCTSGSSFCFKKKLEELRKGCRDRGRRGGWREGGRKVGLEA